MMIETPKLFPPEGLDLGSVRATSLPGHSGKPNGGFAIGWPKEQVLIFQF